MATVDRPGLTDEQQAAIGTRDVSIALSAGAGCGKTFVLTERFLSHLEFRGEGEEAEANVSWLAAMTFTDRAAREMRDRVRRKCRARLMAATSDGEVAHWSRLLRELESARITTIHSFCASLLRAHAVEAGVDPSFAVLQPIDAAPLIASSIDDELRARLRDRDPALVDLLLRYDLRRAREMVETLVEQRNKINLQAWATLSPSDLVARWEAFHRDEGLPIVLRQVANSPHAKTLLRIALDDPPTGDPKMGPRCATLVELLPNLAHSQDAAGDLQALKEAAYFQGIKKETWDDATRDAFKTAAEKFRAAVTSARGFVGFDVASAERAAATAIELARLAAPIAEAYDARKRELGYLDNDDLVARARDLLCGDDRQELRRRLSAGIRLLLVDEFQDTDRVQLDLIRALRDGDVAGGGLFFVGDFKQSIYGFRGADPTVFIELEREIPPTGQLPLSLNFRSQPEILDFVNAVFHDQFEGYIPLRPNRQRADRSPAIEFIWAPLADETKKKGNVAEGRRQEAEWIARRIRRMLDEEESIVGDREAEKAGQAALRPARMGDIVLLFRAMTDVSHYEAALRDHEIDYYIVGGGAFYAQQEIFDVANLLAAIECPEDSVSLAGALRGPFFSLKDETLFWLSSPSAGLCQTLFSGNWHLSIDKDERRRAKFALETLKTLRAKKDQVRIADLLNEAVRLTGYDAILLVDFLGERKLANLNKLIDRARSLDREGVFTLADFVAQLNDQMARQPKESIAATHAEHADVVRLMSIHQAKGLEFPIVFIPDIERKGNNRGEALEVDARLGPILRLDEREKREESGGTDMLALYRKYLAQNELAERSRLFYVACTRAADHLVISSAILDAEKPQQDWAQLLSTKFDLKSGELNTRLPKDFRTPRIAVTTTAPELKSPKSRGHGFARRRDLVPSAKKLMRAGDVETPRFAGPIEVDRMARRRFSFSSLSGELEAMTSVEGQVTNFADLLESDDALALGTIVHEALELVDWRQPAEARTLIERAIDHVNDVSAELRTQGVALLTNFFKTPRARAIRDAAVVHQELEFLLGWPVGTTAAEGPYLHGFIDCLYQDAAGGWHIVDFKTNVIESGTLARAMAVYEPQLLIYRLAAERALGAPIAETSLHFVRNREEHAYVWTKKREQEMMGQIDRALAACRPSPTGSQV